jgi:cell division protein FtsL
MRGQGSIRVALAFAAVLASLTLVIWRQSRALELLRSLDEVRSERALAESERASLTARAQVLESRTRIRAVAGASLGLRVPTAEDLITLRRRPPVRGGGARPWNIASLGGG